MFRLVLLRCHIQPTAARMRVRQLRPSRCLGAVADAMALTLLPATAGLHLFGWSPSQPQRGHRVRPEYCEDLPNSWARQAKLAQLAGRIPTEHEIPSEHGERARVATFAMGCYWGAELAFQREPGVLATCVGHTGYESGGCDAMWRGRPGWPGCQQSCVPSGWLAEPGRGRSEHWAAWRVS